MESGALQGKVTELNDGWQEILAKSAEREAKLNSALDKSHGVMSEMKELRAWLNEANDFLFSRRPVGGIPATAKKQINKHKVRVQPGLWDTELATKSNHPPPKCTTKAGLWGTELATWKEQPSLKLYQ